MIFDTSKGGVCQKYFTTCYILGIFPLVLRKDIRAKGPKTIADAATCLKSQYSRYSTFTTINNAMHPLTSKKSNDGKIADVAFISSKPAYTKKEYTPFQFDCANCNTKHARIDGCRNNINCKLCPGTPVHKHFATDICRTFLSWQAAKIKKGKWIPKKANNAAAIDPLAKMTKHMHTLTTMFTAAVSNKYKRILIDSGCNTNIIASESHSDNSIIYRDSNEGISTANGDIIPIVGQGSILTMPADYVPSFVDSLLSVSQVTKLRNSCFIFLKDVAINVCLNPSIVNLLNQIHTLAVEQNLVLCTANLTSDNLYSVNTKNTPTSKLMANATYYNTAQLDTVADVVRYFHESWSHCSMDLMIHIIKNNVFTNIPSILTEKAIRKYFPICPSCSAGNMTRKSYATESILQRDLLPGEELIMDIKIIADNKNNVSKKSFNNALIIIDNATNYKWGLPLQNHGTSSTIIEKLNIVHKEII